ncbi:MAG: PAS domain S-box protein [Planctomycetales bacterium]
MSTRPVPPGSSIQSGLPPRSPPEVAGEAAFAAAFEEAALGMAIVDLDGHPVAANRRLQDFLGYDEAELREMTFVDFTHPDDVEADWQLFQELLKGTRDRYQIDKRYIHEDGSTLHGRLTVAVTRGSDTSPRYVVGTVEDVSERTQAEDALAEAEQLYRALTEQIPAVTYIVPPDDKLDAYAYISPQVEELLGYPAAQWCTQSDLWERLLHPEDAELAIHESGAADAANGPYASEYRLIARDGHVVWIEDRAVPISGAQDRPMYWHGVMFDVTARKEAEAQEVLALSELRRSQFQQRKLAERLIHVEESERHRIAQDLHDDPIQVLTSVQIRLATIKGDLAAEAGDGLQVIEKSLAATIGRLRTLMFDLRPPVLDREGLAAAVRDTGVRMAEEAGWELDVEDELSDSPPEELAAAAYRIVKEALTNVRRHTQAHRVQVAMRFDGETLSGTVRDDGLGFDPVSVPDESQGHVGLASIRERAEFFGGGLDINSELGHGTIVRFWLPRVPRQPGRT